MNTRTGKHEFAFYFQKLTRTPQTEIALEDEELLHHIKTVLRLEAGDTCVVFNQQMHAQATLMRIEKKKIIFSINNVAINTVLTPDITMLIPLLKRESLKEAVYYAAACGATTIALIPTEKSRHALLEHEYERLQKVTIAAAQQSKQFAFPDLMLADNLQTMLTRLDDVTLVYCQPDGQAMQTIVTQLRTDAQKKIAVLVGPEGDFTDREKTNITAHNALTMRLTPTVLRAEDAVLVALGALRSLL